MLLWFPSFYDEKQAPQKESLSSQAQPACQLLDLFQQKDFTRNGLTNTAVAESETHVFNGKSTALPGTPNTLWLFPIMSFSSLHYKCYFANRLDALTLRGTQSIRLQYNILYAVYMQTFATLHQTKQYTPRHAFSSNISMRSSGCPDMYGKTSHTRIHTQESGLTWCSHFCTGSCHSWCSTRCRSLRAGLGSTSIWGSGCASSCPWRRGGIGRRSSLHILHIASTTWYHLQLVRTEHCLLGSPWSLLKHKQTR